MDAPTASVDEFLEPETFDTGPLRPVLKAMPLADVASAAVPDVPPVSITEELDISGFSTVQSEAGATVGSKRQFAILCPMNSMRPRAMQVISMRATSAWGRWHQNSPWANAPPSGPSCCDGRLDC